MSGKLFPRHGTRKKGQNDCGRGSLGEDVGSKEKMGRGLGPADVLSAELLIAGPPSMPPPPP